MKLLLASLALLLAAAGISFLLLRFGRGEEEASFEVCLECGRREWRVYDGQDLVSSSLDDDGSAFSQRFGAALPPNHAHDWEVVGCIFIGSSSYNVGARARAWIEILPRLEDSAGSEALFREAIALTPEARRELIYSFLGAVRSDVDVDEAFARWNTQRRAR